MHLFGLQNLCDTQVTIQYWGNSKESRYFTQVYLDHWTVSWRENGMILKQKYSRYDI